LRFDNASFVAYRYGDPMTHCNGWVRSLKGLNVVFSGFVRVDGERTTHRDCGQQVESRGGSWADDFSGETDLVVMGWQEDLDYRHTGASRKVELARQSNIAAGHRGHVHIIDTSGFEDLLRRKPGECINQSLAGSSGDRVTAMTADGRRERIEGHLQLVMDPSGNFVIPMVATRGKSIEVFPRSVRVVSEIQQQVELEDAEVVVSLQEAATRDLIRTAWQRWRDRYDVTWDEMYDRLDAVVDPLLEAGWTQTERSLELGLWDEDDFVCAELVRGDTSIDIEVRESGWTTGLEGVPNDGDDPDLAEDALVNRIDLGWFGDIKGVIKQYRKEGWLP